MLSLNPVRYMNTHRYAYMTTIIYCVYSNLRGKRPDQIPFISPSADLMVGPF